MKPNFALSLSFEGIGLLHRAFPGWNRVGEVELDSPDLAGALAVLRETALQINGQDIFSKLVIPNEQIKYLTLDLGPLDEEERTQAIRKALDGATPYPVDHLAFDWSVEGDQTQVAAVAVETLEEAEQFAAEHGFGPICFVAMPPEGSFSGEPFFGPSTQAQTHLAPGDDVQRDLAPIRVTGVVRLPDPGDEVEAPAEDTEETGHAPEPLAGDTDSIEQNDPVDDVQADATDVEVATSAPEKEPDTARSETIDEVEEPVEEERPVSVLSDSLPDMEEAAQDDPRSPSDADSDDASDQAGEHRFTPVLTAADTMEAPSFSSIRVLADDETMATPSLSGVRRDDDVPAELPSAPAFDDYEEAPAPTLEAAPEPYVDSRELGGFEAVDAPDYDPADGADFAPAEEPRPNRLSVFNRKSNELASGLASGLRGTLAARSERRAEAKARAATAEPDAAEAERERMTVFGARAPKREAEAIGGKPRYLGLVLTAILLAFLAGVAAWASIFMDDGLARLFGPKDPEVVMLPPDAPDEMRVEGVEAMVPEAPFGADKTAALAPTPLPETTVIAPVPKPVLPQALTPKEAQDRYAVTGVWQRAPQAPQLPDQLSLDDLYVTSIDPAVAAQDAVALPEFARLDSDIALPRSPLTAKRGARFAFDERGLVVASAEGALSPDGFLVFAGRPANTPPSWPLRIIAQDAPVSDATRARLAAMRPRARPEGIVEQNERSLLGGRTRNELASIRPKLRPESALKRAAEERAKAEAEKLAADQAAVEKALADASAATIPFQNATAQAVATSPKPKSRPRNFSSIVTSTRKAQNNGSSEVTKVAAAVPRTQKTAPRIPSKSSVAKAATVRNQLNLRKINLIGVYGKPSSRRALVRLANGRYKKVKIGDRLDGGRISSISDGELRYSKGGRNVILKMPRQ